MDSCVSKKEIKTALKALRQLIKLYIEEAKRKPLLDDGSSDSVFVQVQLKNVPATKNIKRIKVNLPHSLADEQTEVCLIAGDLDKKNRKAEVEPDKLHYKEMLQKHGVDNVSEVITLRELRTEYKPFEAKLKLLGAYDVFLADNRIAECLPKLLGKHFFKKRKFPLSVNLKTSNLKNQINRALSTMVFQISGQGNTCVSEVAKLNMPDKKVIENIMTFVQALSEHLPGSLENVMGLYLRTKKSKALPIYVSFGDRTKIKLPQEEEELNFEVDELSSFSNSLVKVFDDGTVELIKRQNSEGSDISDSEPEVEECSDQEHVQKNRQQVNNLMQDISQMDESEEETKPVEEKVSQERNKKNKKLDISQLNESEEETKPVDEKENQQRNKKNKKLAKQSSLTDISQLNESKEETKPVDEKESQQRNKKNKKLAKRSSITDISQLNGSEEESKPVDEKESQQKNKKNKKLAKRFSITDISQLDGSEEETKPVEEKESQQRNKKNKKLAKRSSLTGSGPEECSDQVQKKRKRYLPSDRDQLDKSEEIEPTEVIDSKGQSQSKRNKKSVNSQSSSEMKKRKWAVASG